MSENNEPLSDEYETAAEPAADDAAPVPEADETAEDDLVLTPEEAEEEVETPREDRVFGMPRMCFHGVALGIAGGYILTGLIGMVMARISGGEPKMPSATIVALICAGVGYLITKRLYDKKKKAEEETGETEAEQ